MVREDHDIIRALYNAQTPDIFQKYLAQPFIVPSGSFYEYVHSNYDKYIFDTEFFPEEVTVADLKSILPFYQFIFWAALEEGVALSTGVKNADAIPIWLEFHVDSVTDETPLWRCPFTRHFVINQPEAYGAIVSLNAPFGANIDNNNNDDAPTETVFDATVTYKNKEKGQLLAEKLRETFEEQAYVRNAWDNLWQAQHFAMSFFVWVHRNDLYHVEQQYPQKKKKKGARQTPIKPWKRTDHPRTLFLQSMPGQTHESSGNSSRHVSGHMRRGHWRTLVNPRFRHHPQYGKRIRVKPTWVGPTNTTYQGARYVLKEPLL
jgi:hypothetical protein